MTKVLNLDALKTEAPVAIVLDGVRHEMKVATVQTFVDNLKLIEELGTNPSMIREIEAAKTIILRSFPTLSEEQVGNFPLDTLQQLSDLARGANDEIVTTDEKAASSGNAPTAS